MAPRGSSIAALVACLCASASLATSAVAAGPPQIGAAWVTEVTATSANLRAEINPNGIFTTYGFEYIAESAYRANLAAEPPRDGFFGAAKAPPSGSAALGAGNAPIAVAQHVAGLSPQTSYRYRPTATNSAGSAIGPEHVLGTENATNVFQLPDNRGWEMVSPVDKSGGAIGAPEQLFGGGVFQAAADGGSLTYSSSSSFADAPGAPAADQYLGQRGAGGWTTRNITAPMLSGSYGDRPDGVPFQLFAGDLSRGLMLNGERCRGVVGECPVANPPLPGSGAPEGYQNYYLRDDQTGNFEGLLGQADVAESPLGAAQFEVDLAGATADLSHVVLSSCAALTPQATEVPAPGGCDPDARNLYEWSASGLALINLLPGEAEGSPGAVLAARAGAISDDGSRVYWTEGGNLYLRDGVVTRQVDESLGGGGVFETASSDGSVAFFTKGAHLYRYVAATEIATDLTPGGEVQGVLGASADGSRVYFAGSPGLFLWQGSEPIEIAAAAAAGDYPPASGTARVSPDGSHLAFLSSAELTEYDNNGVREVYLYGPPPGGGPAGLSCVSCNPTGERPSGPSSIPGAIANGTGPDAIRAYKPRVLSASGSRLFFDSSDSLAVQDTNNRTDVYEWQPQGVAGCQRSGGCIALISNGRSGGGASFVDASADGSDVFFLTDASLVGIDPGSIDLYDARVGGGFAEPQAPIPCEGDACQSLPEAPEDPTPGTLLPNSGNPPLRFSPQKKKKPRHHKKKRVRKGSGKKHGGRR